MLPSSRWLQASSQQCLHLRNLQSMGLLPRQAFRQSIFRYRPASGKSDPDSDFFKTIRIIAAGQREAESRGLAGIRNGTQYAEEFTRQSREHGLFRQVRQEFMEDGGSIKSITAKKCLIDNLINEEMQRGPSKGFKAAMLYIKEKVELDAQSTKPRLRPDEQRLFTQVWAERFRFTNFLKIVPPLCGVAAVVWAAKWGFGF